MTTLPLQHFRRGIGQFAASPQMHALLFAGTSVTPEQIASPDFELDSTVLWRVCENLRNVMGEGWYLRMPALWSLDVQGDLEGAMRFAPTLGDLIDVVARYGTARWPVMRWHTRTEAQHIALISTRTELIPATEWQMLGALCDLNLQTVLEIAYPGVAEQMVVHISGKPPLPEAELGKIFKCQVVWEAEFQAAMLPRKLLGMASSLADPRGFMAMKIALEAQLQAYGRPDSWTIRVANLLGDGTERRITGEDMAHRLGVSLRTLERQLDREGTSLRKLRDENNQAVFEAMVRRPSRPSLSAIADALGFSDESALSRATRRWYGQSAAEARRRMRPDDDAAQRTASSA